MPIVLHLDRIMKERGMPLSELADHVGITAVNLSRMKTGKVRSIRFSTLDSLCSILKCQPGDLIEYVNGEADEHTNRAHRN
ncbi:transcriptional regulator [Gordonibacter sp. 28C]|uniref:helix-turn-helix domain-containing protein n=1 Tax=Gordonibacter sp. 28C TaxID=2078569 RepID=UPI000DF7FAD2|nr:helix-turn-helix transcriptional regulator [Gordonibacter sp. 28C]RDB64366.1 transcriptional regulator [Gordonibacter sp. 28C]